MKATDLMIRDLMYDNNGYAVLIRELSDTQLSGDKALVEVLEGVHEGEIVPIDTYELSPIPLTREILEKNGLSNRMEFKRFQFIDVIGTQENPIFYWTKRVEDDAVTTVQQLYYVHELQHALRLCKIDKEIVL